MFPEKRKNGFNDECIGQQSTMFDKTAQWVCALLEEHCCLTINGMRGEMAAHFSPEAGGVTRALKNTSTDIRHFLSWLLM